MKRNDEISKIPGLLVHTTGEDGGCGYMMNLDRKKPNKCAVVVWSWGDGWDHVSVSYKDRCPTWDEMCAVKNAFFYDDEECVEYHPKKSEYVNLHPYCLHIWRKQDGLPTPPTYMV